MKQQQHLSNAAVPNNASGQVLDSRGPFTREEAGQLESGVSVEYCSWWSDVLDVADRLPVADRIPR